MHKKQSKAPTLKVSFTSGDFGRLEYVRNYLDAQQNENLTMSMVVQQLALQSLKVIEREIDAIRHRRG